MRPSGQNPPQFPQGLGPQPGRRGAARVRLGLPARVTLISGVQSCRVDDLSQTGARVAMTGAQAPERGEAMLTINGIEAFGTIVWGRGQFFAIAFDDPLPQATVVALRQYRDGYDQTEQERRRALAREFVQGRRLHL